MPKYYLYNFMADPVSSAAVTTLQQSTSPAPLPSASNMAASTTTATASSGSQVVPARIECYFTQSQLALSLSIAKSIPEGMSMQDYWVLLHKHIVQNNPGIQKPTLRYIDSCEFWKDLYEKIHQENRSLQDKVRLLEEKQRVCDRIPSPDSEDQQGDGSRRKRPAGLEEIEEWLDEEETNANVPLGDNHLRLSRYTLHIFRQRRNLERTTKDSNIADHTNSLWKSTRDLLEILEGTLSDCLTPLWTLKCDQQTQTVYLFQQLMHQLTLGFHTCFEALSELTRTITGRKKRFEIVMGLVVFFQHALDYLHTFSGLQADQDKAEKRGLRKKRARTDQSEYAVNKYLSRALVQMTQVDWKSGQLGHSEILEGILCSVLTHTGVLLSCNIFNEHVAESDKAGNISLLSPTSKTTVTHFESRYIISILYAALGGTTKRELIVRVLGDRSLGRSTSPEGHLLSNVKKQLQNTLVRSAVGVGVECLKLPTPPEEVQEYTPAVNHRTEQYGSEWFLEAVWALVGWDLVV